MIPLNPNNKSSSNDHEKLGCGQINNRLSSRLDYLKRYKTPKRKGMETGEKCQIPDQRLGVGQEGELFN